MTEYRSVLERAGSNAPEPDLQVERVLRRRDRKRRNQRIRAGVLGLAIAIGVGWLGVNAIRSTPPVPAAPGGAETGPAKAGCPGCQAGPREARGAVAYEFLDGQIRFSAAPPWDASIAGWEWGPNMATLDLDRVYEERFMLVADPLPVGKGCEDGPAPADAEALALSIRSDPDLEATEPVVVSVGGIDALRMDVVAATEASICWAEPAPQVVVPARSPGPNGDLEVSGMPLAHGHRMRLYLIDLPGGSARILAIAIIAPDARFEHVVEAAAPIMNSFEFHAG